MFPLDMAPTRDVPVLFIVSSTLDQFCGCHHIFKYSKSVLVVPKIITDAMLKNESISRTSEWTNPKCHFSQLSHQITKFQVK